MRGSFFLRVVGRLKPGLTVQQARAALPPLEQSYRAQYPNNIDSAFVTTLRTLPEDVTRNFRAGFVTLFAAVSFVLLIACSNVANLLLVRFTGRPREIALRIAIGASRMSVIRLFVAESLLVSVIAGAGGAFVAWHFVVFSPEDSVQFSSVGNWHRGQFVDSSFTIRDWIVDLNRSLDGNLSGTSRVRTPIWLMR